MILRNGREINKELEEDELAGMETSREESDGEEEVREIEEEENGATINETPEDTEDVNEVIRKLRAELDELKLAKKKKEVVLDTSVKVSSKGLSKFKGKLTKVQCKDERESFKMLHILRRLERLRLSYTEDSLLNALEEAVDFQIIQTIWKGNTLDDIMQGIEEKYNSPVSLDIEEERLQKPIKGDMFSSNWVEYVMDFLHKVELFNEKCRKLGPLYRDRSWTRTRSIDVILEKLTKDSLMRAELAKDIRRARRQKNLEDWSGDDFREVLFEVELAYDQRNKAKQRYRKLGAIRNNMMSQETGLPQLPQPGVVAGMADNGSFRTNCFRCGVEKMLPFGERFHCDCKELPVCSICGMRHLTQFHEKAQTIYRRNQLKRQGELQNLKTQATSLTQGGVQGTAVITDTTNQTMAGIEDISIETQEKRKSLGIWVCIAGRKTWCLLDTGSEITAVSWSFYQDRLEGNNIILNRSTDMIKMANQHTVECEGTITLPIIIEDEVWMVKAKVLKGLIHHVVLGNNILQEGTLFLKDKSMTLGESTLLLEEYTGIYEEEDQDDYILVLNDSARNIQHGDKQVIQINNHNVDEEAQDLKFKLLQELSDITQLRISQDPTNKDSIQHEESLLKNIIEEHALLFQQSFKAGTLKVEPVRLELNTRLEDIPPAAARLKPLSKGELEIVQKWISDCLKKGVIEPSNSTWRSAIFPVAKPDIVKPDGSTEKAYRIVTPFFTLNKYLNLRQTPMPTYFDVRNAVSGATYFTLLDLREGFFQVPLHEASRPLTAFASTGTPLYQYKVVPMGCSISTAMLQSCLTRIFQDEYMINVIVYCDDILIYSRGDETEHLQLVSGVLHKLQQVHATVKLSKVQLCRQEIIFLGFVINAEGITIAPKYLKSVQDAACPTDIKSLRGFIGLINWQRGFIPNCSQRMYPLLQILQSKPNDFKTAWDDIAHNAFDDLKMALTSASVLIHPDFNKPFYLFTDASKIGVGGVLTQIHSANDKNKYRPIAFFSKKFHKGQLHYDIVEKETLAVIWSVEKFRPFIFGFPITIYCDQFSVKYILRQDTPGKYLRYRSRLAAFNIDIQY